MCLKNILLICSLLTSYAESASYDQRQTGNFNVQVDLKDIHIIALMKGGKEEYVDYDYAYDYSEMTIKPQNGSTTPKPLNGATDAENDNTTIATTLFVEQTTDPIKNDSWFLQSTEPLVNSSSDTSSTEKSTIEATTALISPIPTNDKNVTASSNTDCKKGFVLNHKGDCELKLQGTGNA
ncbi:hypothetical protein MSG28_003385 [Choristoneura fumiferana]|nr:hypothetical protein MSG28_003385 [Choristoneura fumiferana]